MKEYICFSTFQTVLESLGVPDKRMDRLIDGLVDKWIFVSLLC